VTYNFIFYEMRANLYPTVFSPK